MYSKGIFKRGLYLLLLMVLIKKNLRKIRVVYLKRLYYRRLLEAREHIYEADLIFSIEFTGQNGLLHKVHLDQR